MTLFLGLFCIYLAISSVTFVLYWTDKMYAQKGSRRISEKTLHLFDLFCGWPGGLLAQKIFHHKTNKTSFIIIYWLTVIINFCLIGIIFYLKYHFFMKY